MDASTYAPASNGAQHGSAASPAPAPATSTSTAAGQASTAAGGSRATFSPTRPPYTPQFSAATAMILKRMKGEASSLGSALSAASAASASTSTGTTASASTSTSTMTLPSIRPAMAVAVPGPTYEDVRRRVVMDMSTTMTLQVPTPAAKGNAMRLPMSAMKEANALATNMNGRVPGPASKAKPAMHKSPAAARKRPASRAALKAGTKRKRGRAARDDEASSVSSGTSDSELDTSAATPGKATMAGSSTAAATAASGAGASAARLAAAAAAAATPPPPPPPPPPLPPPTTTTKSGRQVLKPNTYNPAAMEAQTKKRTHYGKRTAEQALCRRCSRLHSPRSNQMVFCDGCNDGWHQMCHEPWIDDDVVRNVGAEWFCAACQAKRDRHFGGGGGGGGGSAAKRKKDVAGGHGADGKRISWMAKTMVQKRAYLNTLAAPELVNLLVHSLELHPDLPIFPPADATPNGTPRSLFASNSTDGLFTRAETTPNGPINYARKASSAKGKGSPASAGRTTNGHGYAAAAAAAAAQHDSRENSPLRRAWPKAGMGLYSRLPPEESDAQILEDAGDFESFSVMVYDERGRMISENGSRV